MKDIGIEKLQKIINEINQSHFHLSMPDEKVL